MVLLVSHTPNKLLPTIRSRCRKLGLTRLSNEDMNKLLTEFFPDIDDSEKMLLAQIAEGRIGYATTLLCLKGIEIYGDIVSLLSTLPELNKLKLQKLLNYLDNPNSNNIFVILMELLSGIFARRIRSTFEGTSTFLTLPEKEQILEIDLQNNPENWLDLWEKMNTLTSLANTINLDPKQVVLNVFLEIEEIQNSG